ncbi:hypothetical protein SAMN05444397_11444 [Flavobacterium aquidurense]|uniref:Uncharacterized protein n=1 Tax=Flavobacterium frigidimaris TaxID=262320 RepID=A0ABX4BP44_FLAFR|nr:hypothetical protein [Flavobacterium frigidimaris]OXA77864.1 hypothetical protein B0A65_14865 [Flavobacterium frigidimaris]SDZ65342.1 hypothetical protein SAMN05444397_11444 [Flavobacterium aquidurense]
MEKNTNIQVQEVEILYDKIEQASDKYLQKTQDLSDNIQKISRLANDMGNIYVESKRLDNENLKLKNELTTILSEFKLKQSIINNVFAERSQIIDKHFEIIDKGLKENNEKLILEGLKGVSDFVSKNPLENFDLFKKVLTDKNTPLELDF